MGDGKRSVIWNTLKDTGEDVGWEQASRLFLIFLLFSLYGGTSLNVMGKRKREKIPASLNFIRLSFSNCLNYVFNCDDLLNIYLQHFNTAFDSNVG